MNRRQAGFTLVEIMIVVVIIGMLASMAIPAFAKVRSDSNGSRFINDLRIFKDGVELFFMEQGHLPKDSNSGKLDVEMENYISKAVFENGSPIGGIWDIESEDTGVTLAVGVDKYDISKEELQEIDDRFDNGDLASGKLIEIESHRRYYWVILP